MWSHIMRIGENPNASFSELRLLLARSGPADGSTGILSLGNSTVLEYYII